MNHEGTKDSKKKRKGCPSMQRWRMFRWVAGVMILLIVIIITLAIVGPIGGEIRQTTLPIEYGPTAENLLENPMPTSQAYPIDLVVLENASSSYATATELSELICVEAYLPNDSDVEFEFNGRRVNGYFDMTLTALNGGENYLANYCIAGVLDSGLHLLVYKIRTGWTNLYVHQWAIEIE